MSASSCAVKKKQTEEENGRPNVPHYKGRGMVAVLHATRFAQTGVPDDATMPSFEPFGQRAPQMGGCHIQRVPVSSGLSQVWSGFGICDAVEASPRI